MVLTILTMVMCTGCSDVKHVEHKPEKDDVKETTTFTTSKVADEEPAAVISVSEEKRNTYVEFLRDYADVDATELTFMSDGKVRYKGIGNGEDNKGHHITGKLYVSYEYVQEWLYNAKENNW